VWIGLGTLALVFMVVVMLVINSAGIGSSEGLHLRQYSKWWTNGASPRKIQRIVDVMATEESIEIYFNSNADFTLFSTQRFREPPSRRPGKPGFNEFQELILNVNFHPEEFANPAVIKSGYDLELRCVRTPLFWRPDRTKAIELIKKSLDDSAIVGSGHPNQDR
jgi:hypothetical protein